jgi:NAD(P) transhydrogenase subunit alpha
MEMVVGIAVDPDFKERRVALVPAVVPALAKIGLKVLMQRGAGEKAGYPDHLYEAQGVSLTDHRKQVFSDADIFPSVHKVHDGDLQLLHSGQIVIGLLDPFGSLESLKGLAARRVTSFALELLPRISRAQSMDALTSMATLSGYKAVLLAAEKLSKMFPMTITAAGTLTPARVFVVGAGVAGLQAIATARRLGAVVHAFDVRPAVKEEVESLGAKFLEIQIGAADAGTAGGYAKDLGEEFYRRQRELMGRAVAESDAVITTAAVPGKKAPLLVTKEMVHAMRPGSVIVDLAAGAGGNCELTRPGEVVSAAGVVIVGAVDFPSTLAYNASHMFGRNVAAFLENLIQKGEPDLKRDDEIIRETMLTHQGEVVSAPVRLALGLDGMNTQAQAGASREIP